MDDLLEQLRRAILDSGMLPGHVADRAGLARSVVTRLLQGREATVANAERLAAALGLKVELTKAGRTTRRKDR